jgi:hypothetical protein
MATKYEKPVTREIEINGVRVNVSITDKGVDYQPVGRRRSVQTEHAASIQAAVEASSSEVKKTFKDAGF